MTTYRKAPSTEMARPLSEPGVVLAWDTAVIFLCPCGEREVYCTSPPHGIQWDEQGRLTLEGSVGSRPKGDKPGNWCHFYLMAGKVEMCGDAQCPGGSSA